MLKFHWYMYFISLNTDVCLQNLTPKQIFLPLQNAGTFESFSSWIYNDFCVAYLKIFLMWKIGCYSSHVYDL